jgi:peptide chain release factor 3
VPIFTFMNKLDRPARPPMELLDELERVLGIAAFPINWPLGDGVDFKGVFDRESNQVHLFERTVGGMFRAPVKVKGIADDSVRNALPPLVLFLVLLLVLFFRPQGLFGEKEGSR